MSRDIFVFHSSQKLSAEDALKIREKIVAQFPEYDVFLCGPGEMISLPMDTRHLCESVKMLKDMVIELIKANQELVSEIMSIASDGGDQEPDPSHHLGMSHRG